MTDKKYTIIESVGLTHQSIHNYDDIEKHHPTWKEDHKKRFYGEIDGRREEFVYAPDGRQMLSKDIILQFDGSRRVSIPSPVEGYAKRTDRWGMVEIYDQPNGQGHMIARVRHMEPVHIADGAHVFYGEPLGIQGGKNPNGKPFGTHAHIDIDVQHLDQFKQYIKDIDSGVIAPNKYPNKEQTAPNMHYNNSQLESVNPQSKPALDPHKANILTQTRAATDQLCDKYNITNETHRNNIACGMAELAITHAKHPFKGNGVIDAATIDGKVSIRETNGALMSIISADAKQIGNRPAEQSLAIIADYQAPVMIQEAANQTITKTRSMSM